MLARINNTQRVEQVVFEPLHAGAACDVATIRVYYPGGTIVEDQFIVLRGTTELEVSELYYEKWGSEIPDLGWVYES